MSASDSAAARSGRSVDRAFAIATAGIICGFLAVVLSIGHGSLLFSGSLQRYIPVAIGLALFSTTVMAAVCALLSSTRGAVAITQEIPVVAMAAVVTAVAAHLPAGASEETRLATVIVAAAMSTAVTGIVAVALGHFRLGGIIRFAPYPVIGGFLAGTGWLIMIGGISLVVGAPVGIREIGPLLDPAALPKLGAVALLVAALVGAQWRSSSTFVLPAVILVSLVVFHVAAATVGAGSDHLRAEGWLLRLPESGTLWPPIGLASLADVDWHAVTAGIAGVPVVVVLTVIALLMNATGIEIASQQDADLDRELQTVGAMNVAVAAGAGLPGYQAVSLTLLAIKLNAASRWVGLIVAVLTAAALTLRGVLFDLVPTLVLGGVLVWIGGALLVDWLIRSYRRLSFQEYLVILVIFLTIVGVSFLTGIVVGLVAAIILFAVQYGRIDIIRHEMLGMDYQSSVESSERRRELLLDHGSSIFIVRLQGFLFFGTADRLRRRIQDRMMAANPSPHPYVLIDFQRVTGLDSSTVLSFIRIGQLAARAGSTVVLTHVSEHDRMALLRGGLDERPGSPFRFEPDFERGLKWCEDALLAELAPGFNQSMPEPLGKLLDVIVNDPATAEQIAPFCRRVEVTPGTRLIEQGAASDDIFFVESGHAAVEMDTGDGETLRLTTVGHGAVVGEVAFYTGEPRSASVTAEEPMIVWRFSRDDLGRLEASTPGVAIRFHEGMAAIIGRRLSRTNRQVRFLAN